jgi:hypothetical protein
MVSLFFDRDHWVAGSPLIMMARSEVGMFSQSQAKQAVLEWCLPVVHDCLREFYVQYFPLRSTNFKLLAQAHFTLWISLVRGDYEAAQADSVLLLRKVRGLQLDMGTCGAADRYVAAELLDLSLRRFRRMPVEAKNNNKALLTILMHLSRRTASQTAPARFKRAA